MKIAVLAGGLSPERDVSLSSGALIANALMQNGHEVLLIDLYLGIEQAEGFETAYARYKKSEYRYSVPETEPDLKALRRKGGDALIGPGVLELCRTADIVFLALHGSIGEDGRLQAALDTYGVIYTGSGYTGCLLAMDKDLSKELMRHNGITTPASRTIDLTRESVSHIRETQVLPCVVKPCGCGSSVGVSIVETPAELEGALRYAAEYESRVLIEERITGREFSVGVLGERALPPIEIIPKAGFYDYVNKYQAGLVAEVCPAGITAKEDEALRAAALRVHAALRLGDYSRVDFIMDIKGRIYCLEANTLPGMTPTSLLPQEAAADGIPYNELCETIVQMARERGAARI